MPDEINEQIIRKIAKTNIAIIGYIIKEEAIRQPTIAPIRVAIIRHIAFSNTKPASGLACRSKAAIIDHIGLYKSRLKVTNKTIETARNDLKQIIMILCLLKNELLYIFYIILMLMFIPETKFIPFGTFVRSISTGTLLGSLTQS